MVLPCLKRRSKLTRIYQDSLMPSNLVKPMSSSKNNLTCKRIMGSFKMILPLSRNLIKSRCQEKRCKALLGIKYCLILHMSRSSSMLVLSSRKEKNSSKMASENLKVRITNRSKIASSLSSRT